MLIYGITSRGHSRMFLAGIQKAYECNTLIVKNGCPINAFGHDNP
jgi:hypothetical protein